MKRRRIYRRRGYPQFRDQSGCRLHLIDVVRRLRNLGLPVTHVVAEVETADL